MAFTCAYCGSPNTQAGIDRVQCLNCGKQSNFDGTQATTGPDAETRQRAIDKANKTEAEFLGGNYADLQRLGAQKAPDPSEPAFKLPAGTTGENVDTEHLTADGSPSAASPEGTEAKPAEEPAAASTSSWGGTADDG